MEKIYLLFLTIIICNCKADAQLSIGKIKLQEPKIDNTLLVESHGCYYYDDEVYFINKDYVIFENCAKRIVLYPDVKSFKTGRIGAFALDKNGIYLRGNLIKTDTTGFKVLGEIGRHGNYEYLWKTKAGIYRNEKKLTNIFSPETFKPLDCFNGSYFVDEKFVYFFDKKIQGSDSKTIKETCGTFTYDKNFVYKEGEKVTHKGEFVLPVNDFLLKTKTEVLTRDKRRPWNKYENAKVNFDIETLHGLSGSYSIDKNHVYYEHKILPIKKNNFKNIRVFEQVNSAYITDGINVYYRGNLRKNLDAETFQMTPKSDVYFDKNGIYNRKWIKENNNVIDDKLPYGYEKGWYQKMIKNEEKIKKANLVNKKSINYKQFDHRLYRKGDKVYYNDKEIAVGAEYFESFGWLFKDNKNVYTYNASTGLKIIEGVDASTAKYFGYGIYMDKSYVYINNQKIIRSKDVQFLGIFTGYRMGCGQDTKPQSDFYLLKNDKGYWLVENERQITIRFLGKKLVQKDWNPKLKEEFILPK